MQTARPTNLLDVDSLILDFLKKHDQGIVTIHRIYFPGAGQLSLRALIEELKEELKTGCVTFLNKEDSEMKEIDSYLFYIVNDYCKKKAAPQIKKKTEYLCPGCLFLGKENLVSYLNKYFRCDDCEAELRHATDPKHITFFRTFFKHNKAGYRCEECERFIPHPIDDSPVVSCPYYDCVFVGQWSSLRRMHHPTSQSNAETLTLDATQEGGQCFKNLIPDAALSADFQMEVKEILDNQVKMLREIIDYQKNNVPYSSSDFTIKHKYLCYESFDNLLRKHPNEMVEYLLHGSRSGGFQCKVFQEYIRLLEESLPYTFKKNNKLHMVESLLDDSLTLFDGISVFDGLVTDKLEIKNATKEFYVGGRKGAVAQPYYIGRLLSVNEKLTNTPLFDKVVEYSFSKVKLKDIAPGTEVTVTHLRAPPHYQMGGMTYVNRVRKKIIERANFLKSKESND